MYKNLKFILIIIILQACTIKPIPINYGSDNCVYCSMTIVNNQHASELVTNKGKIYKFDAIECMINFMNENSKMYKFVIVNDYSNPGKLVDAKSSTFLISKNIPSPMGAFLSAYASKDSAMKVEKNNSGLLYNWNQIQKVIVNK